MAEPSRDWNVFTQSFVEHWDGFKHVYPRDNQRDYAALVDKMLGCGNPENMGSIESRCLHGGEGKHLVSMSGQSSLCLRCAQVYVDHWVSQVSTMLHEGVISRPIVLPMPAMLSNTFSQQAKDVLSPFMRGGVRCWDDVWSRLSGTPRKGGSIVVMQTHGRNGQSHPHLPSIAPSGGWDPQAKQWGHLDYVPSRMLRKKWPWPLLTMLRQTVKTKDIKRLGDACSTRYREGVVPKVHKGDGPSR